MTNEERRIFEAIKDKYGIHSINGMAAEENSGLIIEEISLSNEIIKKHAACTKATNKIERWKSRHEDTDEPIPSELISKLVEELTDAGIMRDQQVVAYGLEEQCAAVRSMKIERLKKKLGSDGVKVNYSDEEVSLRKIDKPVTENWEAIIGYIKNNPDVSDVSFQTWIEPIQVADETDNAVTIKVPEGSIGEAYIRKQYTQVIAQAIKKVTGLENFDLEFIG